MNRLHYFTIFPYFWFQMMSAIKSGFVSHSRFAAVAEQEEIRKEQERLKKQITIERSGGGL